MRQVQAFKHCPEEVIDGTMRVESDAEQLVENFTPGDSLQYIVRAEVGNLGLEFTAPYTGLDIEVDAVLDQDTEDTRVQNAIDRCGVFDVHFPVCGVECMKKHSHETCKHTTWQVR